MTQNLYTKIINIPEGKEIFFYSVDKTNLLIASTFLDKKYVLNRSGAQVRWTCWLTNAGLRPRFFKETE